jgi:hypothetical protein
LGWRQNAVQNDIVRFGRNSRPDLFIECDSASGSRDPGQEAVVKTPAPAQPVPTRVKS